MHELIRFQKKCLRRLFNFLNFKVLSFRISIYNLKLDNVSVCSCNCIDYELCKFEPHTCCCYRHTPCTSHTNHNINDAYTYSYTKSNEKLDIRHESCEKPKKNTVLKVFKGNGKVKRLNRADQLEMNRINKLPKLRDCP